MRSRSRASAGSILAGTVALLAGGWLSGCHRDKAGSGDIVVWLSANTRGYLEPCGCRRDQAGGLPARMTLVTANKAPNRLLLDAGNITSGGRSYELLKFDYILRGMAAMGYDAVNLGKQEVSLDRDTLRSKIAASKLPFVSCNALDKQSGKPLCAPFLIKSVGGTRFGIVGVVQAEGDDLGPGIAVRPPIEAWTELLPTVKKGCFGERCCNLTYFMSNGYNRKRRSSVKWALTKPLGFEYFSVEPMDRMIRAHYWQNPFHFFCLRDDARRPACHNRLWAN
jgi:hypothetical protein